MVVHDLVVSPVTYSLTYLLVEMVNVVHDLFASPITSSYRSLSSRCGNGSS